LAGLVPATHEHDVKKRVPRDRYDLFWYEQHESMVAAIQREKSIKKYKREWKINLIERENPFWDDLYPALIGMKRSVPQTEIIGRRDKPGDDDVG
jgi:hypothetical protein